MDKWDERFLELASVIATWSKDPSTRVGAIIVQPRNKIIGTGFNGFARGMRDDAELYENREIKYSKVIHAEINSLLNAAQPVEGCTLYTTLPCCDRCAVHMIHVGIKRFVFYGPTAAQKARWNFDKTFEYFKEAGVEYLAVEYEYA